MADGDKHVSLTGLKAVYDYLDSNISGLKSAFEGAVGGVAEIKKYYEFDESNNNKYIKTNFDIGTDITSNIKSPTSSAGAANYHYMIIECSAGDVFDIDVTIDSANPRAWVFTDADDVILHRCANSSRSFQGRAVAPEGSAKLIINDKYAVKSGTVYKVSGNDAVEILNNKINCLESSVGSGSLMFPDSAWESGIYVPGTGEAANSFCCRTDGRIMPVAGTYTVVPKDGYEIRVTKGSQYVSDFTPKPVTFNADGTNNVRIVVRRTDYANILPHGTASIPSGTYEVEEDAVTYSYFATDATLTQSGKWADAKAVGDRLLSLEALTDNRVVPMPPSYFISHLDAKIAQALANMENAGRHGFTFLYFTDPHWDKNNKHTPSLMRYIMDRLNINDVICGGDLICQGTKAYAENLLLDFVSAFKKAGIIFPTAVGNHDRNWNSANNGQRDDASRHLSDDEVWALMIGQYDKYPVVYWDEANGFNYWVDYPNTNTRVIFVDTGDSSDNDNDINWENYDNFSAALKASADKNIIIVAHAVNTNNNGAKLARIANMFNWRASGTISAASQGVYYINHTFDFTGIDVNKTGKVYAVIGGHGHSDVSGNVGNSISVNYFQREEDSIWLGQNQEDPTGTIDEQAFDIVTVNYSAEAPKISFVRVGRTNYDNETDISNIDYSIDFTKGQPSGQS